jgi:hypothetical protein
MSFVHDKSRQMPSCRRSPLPLIQFDEAVKKAGRIRQETTFMARSVLSETPEPPTNFLRWRSERRDLEYSPVPSYARIWAGHVHC